MSLLPCTRIPTDWILERWTVGPKCPKREEQLVIREKRLK